MIANILVARDFSASSNYALACGFALAKRFDATVHMVGVKVRADDLFNPTDEPAGLVDRIREQFKERSRASLTSEGFDPESLRVHHALIRGEAPAPALLEYVEDHEIDLVVLGTAGRRGVRRALMGSVTEEMLRLASCPVLTARAEGEVDAASIQRVVAPTDLSKASRAALQYALSIARAYDVPLALLHVVEDASVPPAYGVEGAPMDAADVDARVQRALNQQLARLGVSSTRATVHVEEGHPVREIVDFSAPRDLIVMSTHGRAGLDRTFMGSVAENVIRRSICPVLSARDFAPFISEETAA
jgi:nucleotide-binding universal stress UspA family protein